MNRIATAAIVFLFATSPVFAHAIRMQVDVDATGMVVKVRYDGANEDGGPVTVTMQRLEPKEEVAKLKLGPDGTCRFPPPPSGLYRFIAEDEFGHRAEMKLAFRNEDDPKSYGFTSGDNTSLLTLGGMGIIGVLVLAGWWYTGRKKPKVL